MEIESAGSSLVATSLILYMSCVAAIARRPADLAGGNGSLKDREKAGTKTLFLVYERNSELHIKL